METTKLREALAEAAGYFFVKDQARRPREPLKYDHPDRIRPDINNGDTTVAGRIRFGDKRFNMGHRPLPIRCRE
jgi:hypothetical protein